MTRRTRSSRRSWQIVAEKTGYPPDMLEMDLDLEADLGVDTVKQAEMFAAVREAYGIERQENLKLRDFPTLRTSSVRLRLPARSEAGGRGRQFLSSRGTQSRRVPRDPPASADPSSPGQAELLRMTRRTRSSQKILEIVAEKTGYPEDMLEMDLDLEADLGVDTVKQAEIFAAVREAYGIERAGEPEAPRLPDAAHVVEFVYDFRPELEAGGRCRTACHPEGLGRAGSRGIRTGAADSSVAPPAPELLRMTKANPVVAEGLADRRREDRLPRGHAGAGPRPRGGPRRRHGEAGRDFAAVREAYGIERQENLKLRDFPTLKHVVQFVYDFRPELKPAAVAASLSSRGTRVPRDPPDCGFLVASGRSSG